MSHINFNNYKAFRELIDEKKGVCFPEFFSWNSTPTPDALIDLPSTQVISTIEKINDKKNPISIQLANGYKLFFTYDEFKRIKGEPRQGKKILLIMQRLPNDFTQSPSQIKHCEII